MNQENHTPRYADPLGDAVAILAVVFIVGVVCVATWMYPERLTPFWRFL